MPGLTAKMEPVPDHGEESYKGSGRLKGKKAVITGADSGIGRAVAIAYAREGADVLISYLEEHEDAEETKKLVEVAGQKALLMPGDIQNAAHCRTIVDKAVSELGGIDILVNNAVVRTMSPVAALGDGNWNRALEVNLSAPFRLIRACLPGMQQRGWGRIVNMASVYSLIALAGRADYVTTKHALIGLTRTVALELAASRVTCNAICPGLMATDSALARIDALAAERGIDTDAATALFLSTRQPGGRFIPMETVTALALFLCGPHSDGINGAAIPVDNGWSFA